MNKILLFALIVIALAQLHTARGHTIRQPVHIGNYDLKFVLNFTRYLHGINGFRSFIVFSEKRELNRANHIIVRPLERALMEEFQTPVVVWGGQDHMAKLRYKIGLNNLIFVYIGSVRDPILAVVTHALEGIHYMPMIFIFKRKNNVKPTQTEISSFFEWCWQENILNVALTYQTVRHHRLKEKITIEVVNEVFNYTPFPKMKILNVTALVLRNSGNFIRNAIENVYDYNFTTPMFTDTPTVFLTDHEFHQGKKTFHFVTGTAGRIFHEYVHYVNGSIFLRPTHSLSYYHFQKETLTYAAERKIDIGIHPYSSLLPNAHLTEGSYPIGLTQACIIVPVIPEIAPAQYIIRTMPLVIWLLWILELVSLFLIECVHLLRFDIGSGILYSFRTLMAQPLNIQEFERRRTVLRFLHLFVILSSVLFNSGFSASLTSILSTSLVGKQIMSVEDLLKSNLKIMIGFYEKEVYFDQQLLPATLETILHVVNESQVAAYKNNLNTSYAYVVTSEEWSKYEFEQQLLWKPKFRIAHAKHLCTVPQYLRFPLQWDSPFIKSLEWFIIFTTDTGLRQAWTNWSIYQATRMKLMRIYKPAEEKDYRPYTINHFVIVILAYCICVGTAFMIFIGELFWFYRNKIIKKLKGQRLT